jgi:DNA-binding transcriptional ArsR family regulator
MARAATTSDVFNAVAEPQRRQILDALSHEERTVNDLADRLHIAQPHVSRHLRVLREVGAVQVRDSGRQRFYRVEAEALKPIHDWVQGFAANWSARFDHMDVVLDELQQKESEDDGNS